MQPTVEHAAHGPEKGRIRQLGGILQKGPHLHPADEARQQVGQTQMQEVQHAAVQQPGHAHRDHHQRELAHGAPRLAALEVPHAPLAPGGGAVGRHARHEVDPDEERDAGHERTDGGEERGDGRQRAANESEQGFHRWCSV